MPMKTHVPISSAGPSDPLSHNSNERKRRQFSLRSLFADITLLAVVFALISQVFSAPSNPLSLISELTAMPVVGAMIGWGLADLLGRRKRLSGILGATAAALAFTPIFMAMEWGHDRPWPTSDWLYVVLAILRCGVLGWVIGWIVVTFLKVTADGVGVFEPSRRQVAKLAAAAPLIAGMLLLWLPVAPWYQMRFAIEKLRTAIEAGTADEVGERALAVRGSSDERGAVGMVLFCALNGRDAAIRIRALEALKFLGDAAREAKPALKPLLDDENEGVRTAAAKLLDPGDPNVGSASGQ